jgi:competence protein ComEC
LLFSIGGSRLARERLEENRVVRTLPEENLVDVEGRLVSLWSRSSSAYRARLVVDRIVHRGEPVAAVEEVVLRTAGEAIAPLVANGGDRIRVRGRLWVPDPSGVGSLSQISVRPVPSLSVKSASQIQVLESPPGFTNLLWRLHKRAYETFRASVTDPDGVLPPAMALLLALSIGEAAELPIETVVLFREGGVAHILAISGLQVGLIAGLLYGLLRWAGLGYRACDALVLLFCLAYGGVAGASAPVLRTVLTIGWFLLARLIGRPVSPWQAVGGAAVVLLAFDPSSLFDVSFHLTFFACAGLSGLYLPLLEASRRFLGWIPEAIRSLLAATMAAEIAVFPVQAAIFGTVPVLGLLSNLVVVPLSSAFLISGLCLVPALLAGGAAAAGASWIIRFQFMVLEWSLGEFDRFRPSRLIASPSSFEIGAVAALVLIGAIVKSRRWKGVALAGAAALVVFLSIRERRPPPGITEVWALDVGQGDSWLLRTREGSILIDGGGNFDPAGDRSRGRVLALLSAIGTTSIDTAILTHPHPDHSRGLVSVLSYCNVKRLVVPRGCPRNEFLDEILDAASRAGTPVDWLGTGDRLEDAGLRLEVLNPDPDGYPRARENNESLVLRAVAGSRRFLFTGDIEAMAERRLLESGLDLSADVLKVAHHGSRTSSIPAFLDAVSPRSGVIGVGKRNRFGHPAAVVVERFRERRIRLFRTDEMGTVKFEIRGRRMFPVFSPFSER